MISTKDGSTLWSESFGDPADRAVLLIMGAMNQGIFWPDDFCHGLASTGHYVIRYDHRDTGKSSTVDFQQHPYDLDTLTQDALAVLRGHQISKAVIVGLSMGGYIAQLLAIDHPEIVDRLVLISTTADHRPYMAATMGQAVDAYSLPAPDNKFLDYLRATAANPPRTAAETEDNMIEGWAVTYGGSRPFPKEQITDAIRLAAQRAINPYACFQHGLAVSASPDRLESVKRIKAPTLIIHGRYDGLLPLAHAEYSSQAIPGAQLQIFEMGHSFMWSWSNEVLASILGFMKN